MSEAEGADSKVITLKLLDPFWDLVDSVHKQHNITDRSVLSDSILALDPGETTGVAEFDGQQTIRVYQKVTRDISSSFDWLTYLIDPEWNYQESVADPIFKRLRYEDYRVYEWKTSDHAWSPVHTVQWIGAIKVAAHLTRVQASCIMAQAAKGWWTDAKLDHFGLNPKGLRHGRDALRHLLYYLLFPTKA